MTFYDKTILPNGLRVITESIPHVRSASIGVWVGAGSYWETTQQAGVSHFLEHMLFKGTTDRTAKQIAQAIDGRGGTLNAFTAKEHTCYYARVLDQHLPVAIDVLSDMLQRSRFTPEEITKEKGVIVEEIRMYGDVPDDTVHELFVESLWPTHPWGRPIVGSVDSVEAFTRDEILAYFGEVYRPTNMVVAAAGRIEHAQVVAAIEQAFAALPTGGGGGLSAPPAPPPLTRSRARIRVKETEQTHLVVGMEGLAHDHDDLYALHLFNTVLGGGAASRLFQSIREERGLAYSVFSYQSNFRDTGNFAVYAGVSPKHASDVLGLIYEAFDEVGRTGVTSDEFTEAQEGLKGQIMLGLESTSGRMNRLGRGELTLGRVLSPDEVIDRIERVTLEQVNALASRLVGQRERVLAVVGPTENPIDLDRFGFEEVQHD